MKIYLFNPFERYSATVLLITGILFSLIGAAFGFFFNARFDGLIDLHFVEKALPYEPFLDIYSAVSCTTILLYLVGKYINTKSRFIDIFNACIIAKIPFYFLTFFNINNMMFTITQKLMTSMQKTGLKPVETLDLLCLLFFSILTILGLIYSVLLLFNGYKVATNAKGTPAILLFIAALILSEISSKFLISLY